MFQFSTSLCWSGCRLCWSHTMMGIIGFKAFWVICWLQEESAHTSVAMWRKRMHQIGLIKGSSTFFFYLFFFSPPCFFLCHHIPVARHTLWDSFCNNRSVGNSGQMSLKWKSKTINAIVCVFLFFILIDVIPLFVLIFVAFIYMYIILFSHCS